MIPRLLLLIFAHCGVIVANGQVNTKRYSEDCTLVTHFMTNNGDYILAYKEAKEILTRQAYNMGHADNVQTAAKAAKAVDVANDMMKKIKARMVDIHRFPEDWTVDDLQKMKNDPKGAEIFKALIRIRNAIYDPEISKEIRVQLGKNLLNAMSEGTSTAELRTLLDRVQTVGGGQPSN